MTYNTGTAAQLAKSFNDFDVTDADSYELGTHAVSDFDAQALYSGINIDEIGSEIRTDANTGETYMYAECVAPEGANWKDTDGTPQCIDENGNVTTMTKKSVMATFAFVLKEDISATNPINFWVHNGNTKAHNQDAGATFTAFKEGQYKPITANASDSTATTYSENRFVSANNQFGAETENFGSRKMTFMGKNENVESTECQHTNTTKTDEVPATCTTAGTEAYWTCNDCQKMFSDEACTNEISAPVEIPATGHTYEPVYTAPTCEENGYTTYTCKNGCGSSYVIYDDPETTKGHNYQPTAIAWDSEDAVTATVTLVCANDNTHTTTAAATVNSVEKSAATCTADQVMTYTASYEGIESISKDVTVADTATGHNYTSVYTEPTCTENGYTTFTCTNTGCDDSYVLYDDPETTKGHAFAISSIDWDTLNTTTGEVTANYVCANDATHTTTGTVTTTASVIQAQTEDDAEITRFSYTEGAFSDSKDVQTKAPAGHTTHTFNVPVSIAWDGEDATTATVTIKCAKCEETTTAAATVNSVEKTPASCTEAQVVTYTASYDGLDSISKDVTVGSPLGHTLVKTDEAPASCTVAGTEAYWTCSTCNKMFSDADAQNEIKAPVEIPAPGHTPGTAVEENRVEPTKTTPGSYDSVVYCTECQTELSRETVAIPALGIEVTVPKYEVGTVTLNSKELDGTMVNTTNVEYGKAYTLAVTDGTEYFKGWEMNGKMVSEETTFTSTACADITITPVFVVPDPSNITVVFYDKFGNKVAEYKDVTPTEYQEAIQAKLPTAPNYPSCTFTGWDTDPTTITESATVWAIYEDVESVQKYTVTVKNADGDVIDDALTLPSGVVNGQIPYDTKATVTLNGAKGWKIGEAIVSTDETYSFFVGADVTIQAIADNTQAVPTTTIIGANPLEGYTYNRYNIMATRNVPAGYELVDYGFVYGKNLTEDDLVIEKEGQPGTGTNSGNVKVARAATKNTASNEFALNYGIKSAGNYVTVKSFVVVQKGADVQVVYSDMLSLNS